MNNPAYNRLFRLVAYVVLFAGAAYLYYLAAHFQYEPRAGAPGPDAWPKGILILMMLVCGYEIVKTLFFGAEREESEALLESMAKEDRKEHSDALAEPPAQRYPLLLLGGMAATVGYVFFVDKLGFFLTTLAYLILFLVLGRYRRWRVIAAVSLIGSLVLMYVFMKVVYVSLPLGEGPFEQVSVALMHVMGIK